jgi:hypothetical protein
VHCSSTDISDWSLNAAIAHSNAMLHCVTDCSCCMAMTVYTLCACMQASGNAIEAGLPLLKKYYKEFMLKRRLATAGAAGSSSSSSGSANAASSTAVVPIKSVTAPGTAAGAAANSGIANSTAGTGAATAAATSKGAWPVAAAVSAFQHGAKVCIAC